jgi:hypothetical protein
MKTDQKLARAARRRQLRSLLAREARDALAENLRRARAELDERLDLVTAGSSAFIATPACVLDTTRAVLRLSKQLQTATIKLGRLGTPSTKEDRQDA